MFKLLVLLILCIPQDVVVLQDGRVTTIPIAELRERDLKPIEVPFFIGDGETDNVRLFRVWTAGAWAITKADIVLPAGIYAVHSDVAIPSRVVFQQGARLLIANGARVILAGGYQADETQHVFDISQGGSCFATRPSLCSQYHWGAVSNAGVDASGRPMGQDNTRAFQSCIDNAMYWGGSSTAYFAPGSFRLDGTLHVGYGDGFRKISVVGPDYSGSTEGGKTFRSCDLRFTTWENGIEIAGARGTTIANLNIGGPWYSHIRGNNMGATRDSLDKTKWLPSGAPTDIQHRYKYSSGIHVDPRSGEQPAVHYSDVDYPDYVSQRGQYRKDFSSQVRIVNCHISGFGCGVATQGCNADGNGDYLSITDGSISSCFLCVAWGNTQARLMRVHGTNFSYYHTAYDTGSIGRQLGKPHLHASSQELGYGVQLGNVRNMSYGAGFLFSHCYAEVLYSLGEFSGYAQSTGGVAFENCEFQFEHNARVVPKSILKLGDAALTVTRSSFAGNMASPFVIEGKPGNVEFSGVIKCDAAVSWTGGARTTLPKAIAHGSTNGLMFISPDGDQGPWRGQGNRVHYGLKSLTPNVDKWGYGAVARSDVTRVIAFSSSAATSSSFPSVDPTPVHVGTALYAMDEGSLSAISYSGKSVVFTTKKPVSLSNRLHYGLAPGSILTHNNSGTLFVVTAATPTQITAEQLNDYDHATNTPMHPIALVGCGAFFGCATGHYVPLYDAELTWKAGSNAVTFTRPDGYGGFPDQFPAGAVRVGLSDRSGLLPIDNANAEITASSPGSITMSGPARLSTTTRSGIWFVPR